MKRKKTGFCVYIVLVMGMCLLPLLTMGIRPTAQTTENKTMAEWPALWQKGGFNWEVLEEAGAYFEDHFAFRQEFVSANAKLRGQIFRTSAEDSVILGENQWLYYEATLDDYQHKNSVSERVLFNIAHNLCLMQEYTENLGKTFLFTIAPNKNSLYGENMPERFQKKVNDESDAERLAPWLETEGVHYVDLFALFQGQEEVLYYERDSHWNRNGAVLVYNALMDACQKEHEDYAGIERESTTDYYGDLNLMLYSIGAVPEEEIVLKKDFTYHYNRQDAGVEDLFVQTFCESGSQNLLMYRDSFGNSLLPFMAEAFQNAAFSKVVPYPMTDLVTTAPDVVVVEKVERHLPALSQVPPVMSGPERRLEGEIMTALDKASFQLETEGSYLKMTGVIPDAEMEVDSRIYIEVDDSESIKVYEAFCQDVKFESGQSDYGYLLYLSKLSVNAGTLKIRVIAERDGGLISVYEGTEKLQ